MIITNIFYAQNKRLNNKVVVVVMLLLLSIIMLTFAPPVFAYNTMVIGEIIVIVQGLARGVLIWNGVRWIAGQDLKPHLSDIALAAGIQIATWLDGIAKFIYKTPWDTLPTPYNAQNAYWDYNNGYWVYPAFAPANQSTTKKVKLIFGVT